MSRRPSRLRFPAIHLLVWWIIIFNFAILFCLPEFTHRAAAQDLPQVRHSVKPLDLSRAPVTEELMAAGQLGGQLYPTHFLANKAREREVNLSFGAAIQAWNMHEYREAVEMFRRHVAQYPDSPWAAEGVLHIGCDALYNGRYTEAENCFDRILEANRGSQHPGARIMVNKARLRLANLKTLQGNFPAAQEHFRLLRQTSQDWRDRTYASHWIQRLSREKRDQLAIFNCGAQALAYLLQKKGHASEARDLLKLVATSPRGHSMRDLKSIAARHGYQLTGLRLTVSQLREIPLPAIVQLTGRTQGDRGHYWVLEAVEQNVLKFFDPQSRNRFRQTEAEFTREWGGNALVFAGPQGLPGHQLASKEMTGLFGGCCGVAREPSNLGDPGTSKGCGAPVWSVNLVNMNFFAMDTPLWYRSPIGPPVEITVSYNSQSSLAQYEPFGNKWQFNYASYLVENTSGQVTVFMPDGRMDAFTPDGNGDYNPPTQVFNRLDKPGAHLYELRTPEDMVYVYDLPAGTTSLQPFLVEIRDAHGLKLTFGYDTSVRLKTITDAVGRVTTLTYNADNLVTQVTDPFGRTAAFNYDANKNLIQITDMGGYAAQFTYNNDRFLTSLTTGRGTWTFYTEPADGIYNDFNKYPAPGGLMWEDYRLTVTDPYGNKEEYYYDGYWGDGWRVSPRNYVNYVSFEQSNYYSPKTSYYHTTVNNIGLISYMRWPLGGGYDYYFDSAGNPTRVDKSNGSSSYSYNNLGRVTSTTNPLGYTINTTYAGNNVDPILIQDDLGQVKLTYNNTHQVTSVTDRLGNVTTFDYNGYGQLTSSTDAAGTVTNYLYDAYHRLVEVRQGRHRTRAAQRLHSYTYDALDRVRTYTDPTGLTVTYEYSNLDQVTRITYPDGKFKSFQYSTCCPKLVDRVTDRSGQTTFYSYDKLNRLTAITDSTGGVTRFAYDANGNRTQLVDPKGNVTRFKYDAADRVVKKIYADGEYELYTYHNYGPVATKRNARGITTYYDYDANNNLTRIYYNPYYYGGDTLPWLNYTHDKYSRLHTLANAVGTYTYEYDANSRLVSVDGPWDNDQITYQYDALGRRIGMTREKGQAAAYAYDEYNRLTAVNAGGDLYYYTYSGVNPLVRSLTRPNGAVTTYQYDALQRLTQIAAKNPAGTLINSYQYTYNAQDLRAAETVTEPGTPAPYQNAGLQYAYNNVNQLLSAADPGAKTFAHDRDGNLEKGYTPEGYAFTAIYDPENRLKSLTYIDGDGWINQTEYLYIGEMLMRVKKSRNGSLVSDSRYVYDGAIPVQERDADNNVTREYTWGIHKGGGIAGLLHLNQGGADYSYLYDGKGNVTAVLNRAGGVAAAYQYDPFGRRRAQTGSLSQPMQFSTKPYDDKTGLSYYGYRFYAPAVGRWMTRDPLGEVGGVNLYVFVQNNPINSIDPNGLIEFKWHGNWGGPGWTAGQYKPETELTSDDLMVPAVDARDACYKQHDICIWNDACKINKCDHQLARCLRKLSPFTLSYWITSELYPLSALRESILFDTIIPWFVH